MPNSRQWDGWMCVLGRFVSLCMTLGIYKSLGIVMPYFINDLNTTAGAAGFSTALFGGLFFMLGPVSGAATKNFTPRALLMTGGTIASFGLIVCAFATNLGHLIIAMVIMGVGHSLIVVPSTAPLFHYFDDNFGMANGISAAGGAVGMAIMPLVLQLSVEKYGWRGACIILAALDMHCVVGGALMKSPAQNVQSQTINRSPSWSTVTSSSSDDCDEADQLLSNTARPSRRENLKFRIYNFITTVHNNLAMNSGLRMFRDKPRFVLYQCLFTLYAIQYSGWTVFIVSNIINRGVDPHKAAYISFIGGIGNFAGRIFTGPVLDNHLITSTGLFSAMSLSCSGALLVEPLANTYAVWATLASLVGLSIGARFPLNVTIAREFASDGGDDIVVAAVGWTYLFLGIGCLVGGPLVGAFFDLTGSYAASFLFMGSVDLVIGVIAFIDTMWMRNNTS